MRSPLSLISKIQSRVNRFPDLFYSLWSLVNINIVPEDNQHIETMAISFDHYSRKPLTLEINEGFLGSIDEYTTQFCICHEMLHVLLRHGERAGENLGTPVANVAMDIAINHMLVNNYGFIRDMINGQEKLCWVDTVFKDKNGNPKDVSTNLTYEEYYKLITEDPDFKEGQTQTSDHSGLGTLSDGASNSIMSSLGKMSQKEVDPINKDIQKGMGQSPGTDPGNKSIVAKKSRTKSNRKWAEAISKNLTGMLDITDGYQWAIPNRRIQELQSDFCMPSEGNMLEEKPRIRVAVFLDTSGSCESFAEPFMQLADEIPNSKFNISVWCFDTETYETDLKSRELHGFGGTCFKCIEKTLSELRQYPDAVFIMTDGYGTNVNPKHPDRWHFYMTQNFSRNCVPEKSHVHEIG